MKSLAIVLLTFLAPLGWADKSEPSKCDLIYNCYTTSLYQMADTGEIVTLTNRRFMFAIRADQLEFDEMGGNQIFGDGTVSLTLHNQTCSSVKEKAEQLADGRKPLYYGWTAQNRFSTVEFYNERFWGSYNWLGTVQIFTAQCSAFLR